MNKGQSEKQMFIGRTGSAATRASRTGRNLLGWGEAESMTLDQQRDALVLAKLNITGRLEQLNVDFKSHLSFKAVQEKSEERKKLKADLAEVEAGLSELKPLIKPKMPDMGECIIKTMKSRMTKPQWQCVLSDALVMFEEANGHAYAGEEYKS